MGKIIKANKVIEVATSNEVSEQDATLTAIEQAAPAEEVKNEQDELVTVVLSNANKTPTAIILKKGAKDSVDGKERWFAKKDLKGFALIDGKWSITARRGYLVNKLVAFSEVSE